MEIRGLDIRGRAAEILCIMYKKPTAFVSRSQKRWGNSIQLLAISGATPNSKSFNYLHTSPNPFGMGANPALAFSLVL